MAKQYLPESLVYRRKNGLLLPWNTWLSDDQGLGRYLEFLSDANAPIREFSDRKKLKNLIEGYRSKKIKNVSSLLNKLINLDLWLRSFSNRKNVIN